MVSNSFTREDVRARIFRNRDEESMLFRDSKSLCQVYKNNFRACDVMNQELRRYGYPFRRVGKDCPGHPGQEDAFAFSTCILNTYFAYLHINNLKRDDMDIRAMCNELAIDIYAYGAGLIREG